MAECKNCGKTYFSKNCPHCSDELVNSVLGRTKKKTFTALIITLLIFASIGLTSYLIAEFINHQQTIENAKKQAAYERKQRIELQREKARLEQKYRQQQIQNNYKSRYSSSTTQYKPRPKTYRQEPIEKEIVRKSYKPKTVQKNTPIKKYTSKPNKKMYTKYSNSIKLKSDSKIKILPDNRLTSNAPIYGTYDKNILFNEPVCKKKEIRDIGLVNDCYVKTTFGMDKLYIKKSRVKEFTHYNELINKQIECDYSKKHGIMHDCKIWNG